MTLLNRSFEELRKRLRTGTRFSNHSDDPVYYLVFPPEQMIEVKRLLPEWTVKLKLDDWDVSVLSMAEAVHDILRNHELRQFWLEAEQEDPLDFDSINRTLQDALAEGDALKNRVLERLEELMPKERALLLITDLEALHPYARIGAIEQRLQGRFCVPTVVLYPGYRTGRNSLGFLGIYTEDGNYRSIHIGGGYQ